MALTLKEKSSLGKASGFAIRQTIPKLKRHWGNRSWLSSRNPYLKNTRRRGSQKLLPDPLCEYIAASAIVHCFDGWSYLGRALEAEISGDQNAARHLGYYAELRAAMSLLASEGIGIVNRDYIIVEAPQKCTKLKKRRSYGTHQFAWDALENWAGLPSSNILFQVIKPSGIPLQVWLGQFGGGGTFVAKRWLLQWGLDLSRFSDDREARNLASYQPSALSTPKPRTIHDVMVSVSQLWKMCNPEVSGGFPILDSHLLRISLEMLMPLPRKIRREKAYRNRVKNMLNGLDLSVDSRKRWNEFLNYELEGKKPQIIQDANGKDNLYSPNYSKQILARATLLLRVATGLSADLLDQAGSTVKADLEFWWQSQAVRRRLWPEKSPVDSFPDLWQDVEWALESIDEWMGQNSSADRYSLWQNYNFETSTLTTTERACLWGLGL